MRLIVTALLVISGLVLGRVVDDDDDRQVVLKDILDVLLVESDTRDPSDEDSVEAMTCDCDYHKGGCTISDRAPPGLACKCVYKGFWTCGGQVTHCKNQNSYYCKHPDRSYQSCKQGEGDCGGYR